jgi:hypothetical protein
MAFEENFEFELNFSNSTNYGDIFSPGAFKIDKLSGINSLAA